MATHLLAERLNTEPAVSRGCSVVEITAMLIGSAGLWLPLGALIGFLNHATQLGLAGGVIGVVISMVVCPTVLQRLKRDRPHGYYQQWFALKLEDAGLWQTPYVRRAGQWDLGRRW
jgi:conjugative transfer region protein (TIGR03750 family)